MVINNRRSSIAGVDRAEIERTLHRFQGVGGPALADLDLVTMRALTKISAAPFR